MPEIKTELPAELIGEAERESHGRGVAVAAVITTLLAATTGFMQASALRTHDEADARAERLGALASSAAAGNGDQAQVQIERFQLLEQEQRQEANADAFRDYSSEPWAALDAKRWHLVVTTTQADTSRIAQGQHLFASCPMTGDTGCFSRLTLPAICSPSLEPKACGTAPGEGGWYSPEQDPAFPTRYQQAGQRQAYFLLAERDAANEVADAAETRFVHLAAALTLFAIAVFLYGYSLTPQGRRRRHLFSRVATAFAVVGAIWAVLHSASGLPGQPASAASAYASGEVALHDSNYATAIKDFVRATMERPKFVDAWSDLAAARINEGIPATANDDEATQVPMSQAMQAAIHDDQHAVDAGSESPTVIFDLGADKLWAGLVRHDDAEVRQSRALSAQADAQFAHQLSQGRHPGSYLLNADFNMAEADLVDRAPQAHREYRAAEKRMLRLASEISIEAVVGSALSDLNLIAQTRPDLGGEVASLENEIVAVASRADYDDWNLAAGGYPRSGHDRPRIFGVKILPDPGHLQFAIGRAQNFDPGKDAMSVQWEYLDPINRNWEVLSDISGPVAPAGAVRLMLQFGSSYLSSDPSFVAQTQPHTCLPPGRYRADVWIDGRLVGQSPATPSSWPDLVSTQFRGVDAVFCRPSAWQGINMGSNASFFTNRGATTGAAIMVLPGAAFSGMSDTDVMDQVVQGFSTGSDALFPGLFPLEKIQQSDFMDFPNAKERAWGYAPASSPRGILYSAVGRARDNEVYVALVFADTTSAELGPNLAEVKNILLSYSRL